MAKIDIVSGFLGAGKTTLIKKLLKEAFADTKVVLIENEFGEIGIDGGFSSSQGVVTIVALGLCSLIISTQTASFSGLIFPVLLRITVPACSI